MPETLLPLLMRGVVVNALPASSPLVPLDRIHAGGRSVKPSLRIFAVIAGVGYLTGVSAADNPVLTVRALRAQSNAAIAAHDVKRLRRLFDDDYHGIQGTSGSVDSGGAATARSYGDVEFKDPTFMTYRRTPESVVLARSGKRIAETGHWIGEWRKSDGIMRKTGIYLATWIPSGGTWRLKAEMFVTLSCTGSVACKSSG